MKLTRRCRVGTMSESGRAGRSLSRREQAQDRPASECAGVLELTGTVNLPRRSTAVVAIRSRPTAERVLPLVPVVPMWGVWWIIGVAPGAADEREHAGHPHAAQHHVKAHAPAHHGNLLLSELQQGKRNPAQAREDDHPTEPGEDVFARAGGLGLIAPAAPAPRAPFRLPTLGHCRSEMTAAEGQEPGRGFPLAPVRCEYKSAPVEHTPPGAPSSPLAPGGGLVTLAGVRRYRELEANLREELVMKLFRNCIILAVLGLVAVLAFGPDELREWFRSGGR